MEELHARIKRVRLHANLTQQQLAEKCGVSRNAVTQWEAIDPEKRTTPAPAKIALIANATGTSTDYLMIGSILEKLPVPYNPAAWAGFIHEFNSVLTEAGFPADDTDRRNVIAESLGVHENDLPPELFAFNSQSRIEETGDQYISDLDCAQTDQERTLLRLFRLLNDDKKSACIILIDNAPKTR